MKILPSMTFDIDLEPAFCQEFYISSHWTFYPNFMKIIPGVKAMWSQNRSQTWLDSELRVVHIISLRQIFDQSLMKIILRIRDMKQTQILKINPLTLNFKLYLDSAYAMDSARNLTKITLDLSFNENPSKGKRDVEPTWNLRWNSITYNWLSVCVDESWGFQTIILVLFQLPLTLDLHYGAISAVKLRNI